METIIAFVAAYLLISIFTALPMLSMIAEFKYDMRYFPHLRAAVDADARVEHAFILLAMAIWPITWLVFLAIIVWQLVSGIWWLCTKGACRGARNLGKIASAIKQDIWR